ncbi:MAG: type I glutamate--ammonia ligase, partial [Acidimicrobiales bacterium]
MSTDELRSLIKAGDIDTVVVAMCDMQGRLQGKRCHGSWFLDEVLSHAMEGCNYLLAVDVDMRPVDGYELTSWEQGYGDFVLRPDLTTLCRVPWHPGTALCMADVEWHDGRRVTVAPRQVLRAQLERLATRRWTALAGTELEFMVFSERYEEAWTAGYRGLTPVNQYNVDYSLLGTGRIDTLLRRIRLDMAGAGLEPEAVKGECNLGQHEISFRYADALRSADQHALYKLGAKEIAAQEQVSLTFMAKFDEHEGNSCHIHLSLRDDQGAPVFAAAYGAGGGGGEAAA